MQPTTWSTQLLHHAYWIPEGTTSRYSVQLVDESNVALTLTQVTAATLVIYDLDAIPPVVLVGPRDIKNTGGGAISSSGMLVLTLSPVDNALVDETQRYERRRWLIEYTYATGSKTQRFQVDRIIANTLEP